MFERTEVCLGQKVVALRHGHEIQSSPKLTHVQHECQKLIAPERISEIFGPKKTLSTCHPSSTFSLFLPISRPTCLRGSQTLGAVLFDTGPDSGDHRGAIVALNGRVIVEFHVIMNRVLLKWGCIR